MAGNTVQLVFAGDSRSLERTFSNVGSGAKKMAGDLDAAGSKAKGFGSAMDKAGDAGNAAEGKFRGAADVLDGLGGAFGVNTDAATGMMRSMSDLSGGFSTLQPLVSTVGTALKTGVGGAMSFIAAHPVLITLAALTAAFVLLWQHSETFRDIVKKAIGVVGDAFGRLKDGAMKVVDFIKAVPEKIGDIGGRIAEFFTGAGEKIKEAGTAIKNAVIWPYKMAFNAIADIWNNTVGALSFKIPSWVPGMGGKGFDMPNIPKFHTGGVVPGPVGAEVPIMAMAGETVVPRGQSAGGGPTVVHVYIDGREIHQSLLRLQRTSGPLGLTAS